jgi:hypothetical protein
MDSCGPCTGPRKLMGTGSELTRHLLQIARLHEPVSFSSRRFDRDSGRLCVFPFALKMTSDIKETPSTFFSKVLGYSSENYRAMIKSRSRSSEHECAWINWITFQKKHPMGHHIQLRDQDNICRGIPGSAGTARTSADPNHVWNSPKSTSVPPIRSTFLSSSCSISSMGPRQLSKKQFSLHIVHASLEFGPGHCLAWRATSLPCMHGERIMPAADE